MKDSSTTKQALIDELASLKQRIKELEQSELDLKQAKEALQESKEQLRVLSENLAEGMVYQINSGPDGQQRMFTYLSPAIERLHGLKVEDVKRNPSLIYDQVDGKHRVLIAEAEAHAYATRSKLDIDLPIRHPSGDVRWRRFISSPRTHSDGSIIWDGIELDIDERKRVEDETTILVEIGRVISSTLNIDAVYEQFASITRKLIHFDTISVNLIDVPKNLFHIAHISGLDLPWRSAGLDIPLAGTMTEYVMHRQKAMMFEASSVEEMARQYPGITRILSIQAGFYSNMLIPLFSNDVMIGVLHFRAKKYNAYSEAANGILFDVTKQKLLDEELRFREIQLRAIVESTGNGILAVDSTGQVILSNRRYADLWNIPTDLLERNDANALRTHVLNQLVNPDAFLEKILKLYQSIKSDYDIIMLKDGRMLERYSYPLLSESDIIGRAWSFRDITAQIRAESALRNTQLLFKNAFSMSPAIMGIHRLSDEVLLEINETFTNYTGYQKEELIGHKLDEFGFLDSSTMQQMRKAF